jgi:alginate O-acetyltransferase complex protein AlgI
MSFQSLDFALFLPVVFLAYWLGSGGDVRRQNWIILMASLIFYGWWDWRFVALVLASAFFNYHMALSMQRRTVKSERARLLWLSVTLNLAVLIVFKYLDFLLVNFSRAFSLFGMELPVKSLDIILPLGISFYTFQSLGYVIDVYRNRFPASNDPVAFLGFMTFFPKIVAGPIERASSLLPQFARGRTLEEPRAVDGLRRILLGLFMKLAVADNIDIYIDQVFAEGGPRRGSTLFVGLLLRPMRVYADFAGYSEIAIGTASLFGFSLMRNFSFPFFATNLVMLWQRWHMSLTNWFRDYVFMVLPARRSGKWILVRNISVIYILSGLWHAASWNYLSWGLLNALLIGFYLYFLHFKRRRVFKNPVLGMMSTYLLFSLTMVPLSAPGISLVIQNVKDVLSPSLIGLPYELLTRGFFLTLCLTCLMLSMEWASRKGEHGMDWIRNVRYRPLRWFVYLSMALLVFVFSGNRQPFIYVNF